MSLELDEVRDSLDRIGASLSICYDLGEKLMGRRQRNDLNLYTTRYEVQPGHDVDSLTRGIRFLQI